MSLSKSASLLTAGGFLSFFVFGFIDNLKGPILPELLRAERLSYSQGGTILLAVYFGFVIATLLTGIMADVVGNRGVLLFAGICLCLGLGGVGIANSFALWMLLLGVVGLGLGAVEDGANGLMVELHPSSRGRYLNLLAAFHGAGSLLVPLYAAWLITLTFSWQSIYVTAAAPALLLTAIFQVTKREGKEKASGQTNWDWPALRRVGFTRRMRWYYLLITAYVAVELGVAAWMVEYLQNVRGFSIAQSSFTLSGFFVMIMLGRFLGSFVVEKLGYRSVLGMALLGGLLCLTTAIFGPKQLIILLPLSGLFFSIVFPTVTAAVTELHQANIGSIMGILFTFGGIGGALGPWTVGMVSDQLGLQFGMASTIGYCVVALFAWSVLNRTSV